MRHVRTDPACVIHKPPRGRISAWWFDRHRGVICPICEPLNRVRRGENRDGTLDVRPSMAELRGGVCHCRDCGRHP